MKVFGVGCLQFRYKSHDLLERFNPISFKKDILSALENIENLSHLDSILLDDDIMGFRSFPIDSDGNVYPCVCEFQVAFKIYIPLKAHSTIVNNFSVEHFNVHIRYGYEKPVMYVWYEVDEITHDNAPSDAIIVVREYLKSRISGNVLCDIIGPSPFHANFFISETDEKPKLIDLSPSNQGYGLFKLSIGDINNTLWGLSSATYYLTGILSRFYYLEVMSRLLNNRRRDIIEHTNNLLEDNGGGILSRIRNTWKNTKTVESLQRSIIEENVRRIQAKDLLTEYERQDGIANGTPLRRYFSEFEDDLTHNEWRSFSDVAKFFEERRLRLVANFHVVFAGLFGGLIGALLGLAASYPSVDPPYQNGENQRQIEVIADETGDSQSSSGAETP